MRIGGSSAMSRDVLWRVSGPALEWRKRLRGREREAESGGGGGQGGAARWGR